MKECIGLGILVLIVLGSVIAVLLERKRRKELDQLAKEMHFAFDDKFIDDDDDLLQSFNHLALFRQTRSQGAWNVLRGQADNIAVTIMDHRCSSGSRNSSEQTVIVFQSDLLNLPSFTLRPESFAHRLFTAVLGYPDINFDDHPTFSTQHNLHGHDEKAIRQLFKDKVISYFEQHGSVIADGSGNSLMFCRLGNTVAVKDIQSFLDQGFEVFSLFKEESKTIP